MNIDKEVVHVLDSSLFAKKETSLEQSMHVELDVENYFHLEQETRVEISSLTSQIFQHASTVSKLKSMGKLLSQPDVANVSVITLCTSKVVDTPSSNTTLHKSGSPFLVKKDKVDSHLVAI